MLSASAFLPKKAFGFLPKLRHWYFIGCSLPFCSGASLMLFTMVALMVTVPASETEKHFCEKLLAYLYYDSSILSAVYSMVELYTASENVFSLYPSFSSQKRKAPCNQ